MNAPLLARLALLLVIMAGLPTAHAARTHLVTIGANAGRADEAPLRYAHHDAALVGRTLRRLGGVQAQDLAVLEGATAGEVRRTLHEVNARIRRGDPESAVLIVYYSGHADATGLHLGETTFDYDELRTIVSGSPARVRLLILDGCRSGGLTQVKGAISAESFSIRLEDKLAVEGLAVMTSSTAGEDSHESRSLQGSFFTHHLLAALVGAGDRDRDGRVTLNEGYTYAFEHTLRSSGRTTSLQHPTYAYDLKGRGDLILTRLAAGPGSGRLRLGPAATYLLRESSGRLWTEVTSHEPGAVIVVPAALYLIEERHKDHYRELSVQAIAGQEVDLTTRPARRISYARLVRKGAASSSQRLWLLGAAWDSALEGRTPGLGGSLVYALDLPWATLSLRGRFGQSGTASDPVDSILTTAGLGLAAERVVDLNAVSISVGLFVEGQRHWQAYGDDVRADARTAWGLGFGGLGALEIPVTERFALRVEGGPVTQLRSVARVDNGAESGAERVSRLTWWAGLGLGVHL